MHASWRCKGGHERGALGLAFARLPRHPLARDQQGRRAARMFRRRALPLAQLAAQELQMPHVPHVPRTSCQAFATYDVNANGMHLVVLMYADVGTAYITAVSRHHTYAAVTSVLKRCHGAAQGSWTPLSSASCKLIAKSDDMKVPTYISAVQVPFVMQKSHALP